MKQIEVIDLAVTKTPWTRQSIKVTKALASNIGGFCISPDERDDVYNSALKVYDVKEGELIVGSVFLASYNQFSQKLIGFSFDRQSFAETANRKWLVVEYGESTTHAMLYIQRGKTLWYDGEFKSPIPRVLINNNFRLIGRKLSRNIVLEFSFGREAKKINKAFLPMQIVNTIIREEDDYYVDNGKNRTGSKYSSDTIMLKSSTSP